MADPAARRALYPTWAPHAGGVDGFRGLPAPRPGRMALAPVRRRRCARDRRALPVPGRLPGSDPPRAGHQHLHAGVRREDRFPRPAELKLERALTEASLRVVLLGLAR